MLILAFSHHALHELFCRAATKARSCTIHLVGYMRTKHFTLTQRSILNSIREHRRAPVEQNKREAVILTVQTGHAAKYRSAQQTVSKPSSHN